MSDGPNVPWSRAGPADSSRRLPPETAKPSRRPAAARWPHACTRAAAVRTTALALVTAILAAAYAPLIVGHSRKLLGQAAFGGEVAPRPPRGPFAYFPGSPAAPAQLLVPPWNRPPAQHVPEPTPLFIGFARNWALLRQAVASYVAAGWPPLDIYVVDNTGVMDSNARRLLTPQNMFFMNYTELTDVLGVNVLVAPTHLNFAQLHNYYLFTALQAGYEQYFTSHMDVLVLSDESAKPFRSFYMHAVDALRAAVRSGRKWGVRFFAYDYFLLVNVDAWMAVGGWDVFLQHYSADCDMFFRVEAAGYELADAPPCLLFDAGTLLPSLQPLFRARPSAALLRMLEHPPNDTGVEHPIQLGAPDRDADADGFNSPVAAALLAIGRRVDHDKKTGERLAWQMAQSGGQGEPFHVKPRGYDRAFHIILGCGREVYGAKWGTGECRLRENNVTSESEWQGV